MPLKHAWLEHKQDQIVCDINIEIEWKSFLAQCIDSFKTIRLAHSFCCDFCLAFLQTHILTSSAMKQRFLSSPAHSWTPTMPKMKKTKKQRANTLPSIGSVSRRRVTRMRIPKNTHSINTQARRHQFVSICFLLNVVIQNRNSNRWWCYHFPTCCYCAVSRVTLWHRC